MRPEILFSLLAAFAFCTPARADLGTANEPVPQEKGMDVPVNQVTGYSGGHCQYDKHGGGNSTAMGHNPRQHTWQHPGEGFASAAVPQHGGNAGIFRCKFQDKQNYPGITFWADDHYDDGSKSGINSNGMSKYDASWDCVPGVKSGSKPGTTLWVQGTCGGQRGGAGDGYTRPHKKRHRHG